MLPAAAGGRCRAAPRAARRFRTRPCSPPQRHGGGAWRRPSRVAAAADLTVDFLVDASKQTVEDPARLTFAIDADLLEGERDPDQLNVFYGALGVTDECEANREARPDPCIESRSFEANGDARIVVFASRPATD